jgi:hypothetical protein
LPHFIISADDIVYFYQSLKVGGGKFSKEEKDKMEIADMILTDLLRTDEGHDIIDKWNNENNDERKPIPETEEDFIFGPGGGKRDAWKGLDVKEERKRKRNHRMRPNRPFSDENSNKEMEDKDPENEGERAYKMAEKATNIVKRRVHLHWWSGESSFNQSDFL